MNFKEELIDCLIEHNKTLKDIKWVGNAKFKIPLDVFFANIDFDYDADFGSQKVAEDLLIVGEDWWLDRGEYDGSEWFNFHTFIKEPEIIKKYSIYSVEQHNRIYNNEKKVGWETLDELNHLKGY